MKFKFKHADKIVGLFILLAALFLVTVLIFIGINKRWFAKDLSYTSQFNSATRLKKNMPIVLSGVKIGHVEDFILEDINEVSVVFTIYEEYQDYVRPNSVLKMGGNALGLGGGGIYFFPGKAEGTLPEGTFIPSLDMQEGRNLIKAKLVIITQEEDDIDDILKNIKYGTAGLEETITSINQLATDLDTMIVSITSATEGTGEGSLNDILVNLEELTDSLTELGEALEDPEGLVPTLLASEGSTVDTLFNDNNDLYNEIYSIFGGLDDTVANLIDLTDNINGMTPQMNLVLEELNGTLKETQKVLEGLKNNPLLKGGISQEVAPAKSETELREEEF